MSHKRKPFTVENQRPRHTVNLYGSILAPKGKGRTSLCDLSAEELSGDLCASLIAMGRIKIVRDASPASPKKAAAAPSTSAPVQAPTVEDSPVQETVWDEESIKLLSADDQKALCKSLGLKQSGREHERVKRILKHIEEG